MKKSMFAVITAAALFSAAPATAQTGLPITAEIRGGLGFPVGSFADFEGGVKSAWSLGANAQFRVMPALAVYGGYTHTEFNRDLLPGTVRISGPEAGVIASVGGFGLSPFVKAGVNFHNLDDGHGHEDSRRVGFEGGAGLDVPLGPTLSFTPAVTYNRVNLEVSNVDFVKVDVGLKARF